MVTAILSPYWSNWSLDVTEEVTGRRTLVLEGSIGSKRQKADELRRLPRGEMSVSLSAVRFQRKLLRLPLTLVRASKSGVTHAEIVTCAQALWRVPCQARARRPAPVDASPRQAGPPPPCLRCFLLPTSVGHGQREPDTQLGATGLCDSSRESPALSQPCRRLSKRGCRWFSCPCPGCFSRCTCRSRRRSGWPAGW